MSVGEGEYLYDDSSATTVPANTESLEDISKDNVSKLFSAAESGTIDLDEIMIGAADASISATTEEQHLAKIWRIDVDTAKRATEMNTKHGVKPGDSDLSRNYSTNDRMLRYRRIEEYFFMDTFFSTKKAGKSSRGNTCCQLFVTDKGFIYVVPMTSKSQVLLALKQFAKEVGAPDAIICDAARDQQSRPLKQFLQQIGTSLRVLEENTPWANKAELYIGILKEAVRKDMKESSCPLVFWDFCVERRARVHNLTPKKLFSLKGNTPHFDVFGEEGDISNLCQFGFYDWCYFREQKAPFPYGKEVLGRVLGPARGTGNEMCQWVLKANGEVVARRTTRPLRIDEIHSEQERKKRDLFDELVKRRRGTSLTPPTVETNDFEPYSDEEEKEIVLDDIEDTIDHNGQLLDQQPAYDRLLHSEILVQKGDSMATGIVKRRAVGPDGNPSGTYNDNPFLNTYMYEVEFSDGDIQEYSANVIAERILSQADDDGFSRVALVTIDDYKRDPKLVANESFVTTNTGQRRRRKTTKGWKLRVVWSDGSTSWVPLRDLKESHPVELAEFAVARNIADEPAFAWWVPYTLRKKQVILSKLKARLRKTTHKYGVEMPTSVEHAFELDKRNQNTFWRDALNKEMVNVGIAFEVLDRGRAAPVGWKKVTGHLVWDLKMDFTRKARWVLDGHRTPDPIGSRYAGVVSRDSVRIAFTYAALNDLDVCAADIRNAYLQAPSSQKDFIICGPEFGLENVGKVALIHRALYGGKTAGRDFRNHLRACMFHLHFTSCPADPDVWMRPAKKADGSTYYEYLLLYTDDCLAVGMNPEGLLRNELGRYFQLKEESIGPPDIYLGGKVRKVRLENGTMCWAFGSSQYVKAAVANLETYLSKPEHNYWGKLPKNVNAPLPVSYRPELDVSRELTAPESAYYQSLIGILRWIVELGRIDICLEASLMASHLALPRDGHMRAVLRIFGYLKSHHNAELVYDPSDILIDELKFERRDWTSSEFGHIDGVEELPPNAPEPRGFGFTIRAKVDADHATDTVTRRSRTGFIVYLNSAPIYWMSKKQSSIESSSFGSEFTAMKQCCEYIRGLRYKLRMLGIPCEGPAYIEGDNQSVLANTTVPDSMLKKKSQSIAYHFIREGVARDEWRTAYVNTNENEADLLTKVLPYGEKRRLFVRRILHHIYQ